jgi:hypothetical protein
MKTESIELQPRSGKKESAPLVRQFFRIPVSETESAYVVVHQNKYRVANISQGGVGIHFDAPSDLKFGEIYTDCELVLGKERFGGLTGKVIHYSPSASGELEQGIQWVKADAVQRQALDTLFSQMKTRFLENNDRKISNVQR